VVHFLRLSTNGVVVVGAVVRFKFLSRDFLQTITFGNTLLSNLFFFSSPSFGAVYIMRLLVSHFEFFFLRKQKWRTLFSPQKFPMGYLYFESNRRWIDQVDGYMAAQVGVAAGSWSMTQGRKKNPKMIQWVFVERIIAVEKTKIHL
jgi:hypothetical protein